MDTTRTFDLVIVGSGSAALTVAFGCREAGWSVAVVDRRPLGGTCALRGCDPKKVLVGASEIVDRAARMKDKGLPSDLRLDWGALQAFKRTFTQPVPAARQAALHHAGIAVLQGTARFCDHQTIDVDGWSVRGRHILIATGAEPAPLRIPGEAYLASSDAFLDLEVLPPRIVMVGGGYIAAEFASIAAAAGSEVTIVQRGPRLLEGFDPDLVGWLMERLSDSGVRLALGTAVEAIEPVAGAFVVHARSASGAARFEADLVVHAAGRVPSLAALDLEAGSVATERGRLKLNPFLQSCTNPIVYAAGDAASRRPSLTPIASSDGRLVLDNLLNGNRSAVPAGAVPSVAFTIPPIASVGLSEAEARARGCNVIVRSERVSDWYSARRLAEPLYGYKIILDEAGFILGAHLVGPDADELINLLSLAITHGLTAAQLKQTLFAYPTAASDLRYML